MIGATTQLCKSIFDSRITPALSDLSGCLTHSRNKRDIATMIGVANTVAGIIVGVTNLLKGAGQEVSPGGTKEVLTTLSNEVEESSNRMLKDKGTKGSEVEKAIEIVSDLSTKHMEQLKEIVESVPLLVWMFNHISNELYAGIANIKAIQMHCTKARIATQELAEILEIEQLGEIQPTQTKLEAINVDSRLMIVEFVYRELFS